MLVGRPAREAGQVTHRLAYWWYEAWQEWTAQERRIAPVLPVHVRIHDIVNVHDTCTGHQPVCIS